mmetsp:Transcript_16381/g.22963  ORF Transcript_16381/g.22963 Transcript_16381/m.22963 type:complete len:206 (-) Transcript_16381:174-791(-)
MLSGSSMIRQRHAKRVDTSTRGPWPGFDFTNFNVALNTGVLVRILDISALKSSTAATNVSTTGLTTRQYPRTSSYPICLSISMEHGTDLRRYLKTWLPESSERKSIETLPSASLAAITFEKSFLSSIAAKYSLSSDGFSFFRSSSLALSINSGMHVLVRLDTISNTSRRNFFNDSRDDVESVVGEVEEDDEEDDGNSNKPLFLAL